ncbi:MAG: ABC transporter permease [Gammaproteobacteria bacterium]
MRIPGGNLPVRSLPRLWARDLRGADIRILALALVIAVTAVTAVDLFLDRIRQSMDRQGAELLAGDLVVDSPRALPTQWADLARTAGLDSARTVTFPSVIFHGDRSQLVRAKAVTPEYPLRGSVRVRTRIAGPDAPVEGGPPPGTAWAEPRLLASLDLEPGDPIELGDRTLRLERIISFEPDRGADMFQVAPRLMFNHADLDATGLVTEYSRVRQRMMFAGPAAAVRDFRSRLEPLMDGRDRLRGLDDNRPAFRTAQQRAERFLGLSSMATVLLAGAAIALGAHRYRERQSRAVALMRTLGAKRADILALHLGRMIVLALGAGLLGIGLGYAVQAAIAAYLADVFTATLPPPRTAAAFAGLATSLVALAGFALPQVLRLVITPPMRVLRQQESARSPVALATLLTATLAFAVLLRMQAGEWALTLYVLGGTVLTGLLALGGSLIVVRLSEPVRQRLPTRTGTEGGVLWALRFGLGNLHRHRHLNALLLAAFGVGLLVLLLLSLVRNDLLGAWSDKLPADTPNTFLINVQSDEVESVSNYLNDRGLGPVQLQPMIRARLESHNGTKVKPEDYASVQARRTANRNWNLSLMGPLASSNHVVEGRWPEPGRERGLSVERRMAERMSWSVGDTLRFAVGSRTIEGEITSIREVDWDSFQVNFFVLVAPELLADLPGSYITSFHIPPDRDTELAALNRAFPTITAIDVNAIMGQVRTLIDRAGLAIQAVFLFTLAASATILLAGFETTAAARSREVALLRTMGASTRQVLTGASVEYLVLGLLCGLAAASAASLTGWLLAANVLNTTYAPSLLIWLTGLTAGPVLLGLSALWPLRTLLKLSPTLVLRSADR